MAKLASPPKTPARGTRAATASASVSAAASSSRRGASRDDAIDLTGSSPILKQRSPGRVKKQPRANAKPGPKSPSLPSSSAPSQDGGEKRLRQWRDSAPKTWLDRHHRAMSQRMFVISRTRGCSTLTHPATSAQSSPTKGKSRAGATTAHPNVPPSSSSPPKLSASVAIAAITTYPTETVELAGSTGNIYTVVIDRAPRCDCPDSRKGNQCKHVIYVLCQVLKAREPLRHQLAFLTTELCDIFEHAPPIGVGANGSDEEDEEEGEGEEEGRDVDGDGVYVYAEKKKQKKKHLGAKNRKPIEGDCPICFMEMEEKGEEKIVFCRASCGQNVHASCFEQWAASSSSSSSGGRGGGAAGEVRCVYCRAAWQGDDDAVARIRTAREKNVLNGEGYVNVARELGISGSRDTSSYHQPWVRTQLGGGGHGHRHGYAYGGGWGSRR